MTRGMDADTLNSVFPIVAVDIYASGIQVRRKCLLQSSTASRGKRKPIKELTRRSLSRLAFVVSNTEAEFKSMVTLTYPNDYPLSGKVSKGHLHQFLNGFQSLFGKQSYFWFLEFTKKDRPHYHLLVEALEPNKWMREKMGFLWATIVSRETIDEGKVYRVHSHPKAWSKIRKPDGARRYALKYATKIEQKTVPSSFSDVGRFWGCSVDVIPVPKIQNVAMDDDELREWLYARSHHAAGWEVIPKYLWYVHHE